MYRLTWWQQVRYQAGLTLIGLFVLIPLWGIIYLAFDGASRLADHLPGMAGTVHDGRVCADVGEAGAGHAIPGAAA
ncbi:hypothetical protein [Candidatus Amarolinea dominans]|uniref:hypothetical protein n=1 Tax=Candidatus Amarolinea dominans TaxID=3140696 RepID=UPI0031363588|nr:hypothetical protein [Anaerolineae bacterium]